MVEDSKSKTEADKQILRLEALRLENERQAQARALKAQRAQDTPRTAVERTMERLEAMRDLAGLGEPTLAAPQAPTPPISSNPVEPLPPVEAPVVKAPEPNPPLPVAPPPPPEPVIVDLPVPPPPPMPISPAPVSETPAAAAPPPIVVPEGSSLMDVEPVGTQSHHGDMHPSRAAFPRFDGKYKNVKLTVAQMQALEALYDIDPRLYPARILRIALNQWLDRPNLPEDQAFEPLCRDALIRIRKGL